MQGFSVARNTRSFTDWEGDEKAKDRSCVKRHPGILEPSAHNFICSATPNGPTAAFCIFRTDQIGRGSCHPCAISLSSASSTTSGCFLADLWFL